VRNMRPGLVERRPLVADRMGRSPDFALRSRLLLGELLDHFLDYGPMLIVFGQCVEPSKQCEPCLV